MASAAPGDSAMLAPPSNRPTQKLILPNVRKLIIPDPDYEIYEADLAGADAQVVAWEAQDDDLKAGFRAGIDIHVKNAEDMWGNEFTRLSGHARRAKRQECKHTVHGCNYGCTPRTTAIQRGWTVHEAERFHSRWFSLHPGIKTNFHQAVERNLNTSKTVTNPFGFRRPYFDRPAQCFTEALAWIPQSTVAINTYLGAFQLEDRIPEVEILLQVHDSLVFQLPLTTKVSASDIKNALRIETPYPDPLYIPWGLKKSTKSWGDCEEIEE